MSTRREACLTLPIGGLAVTLLLGFAPAIAAQGELEMASGSGACSNHALQLRSACFADRRDDYLIHLADCSYVFGREDQATCRDAAGFERAEKTDECEEIYEARLDICEAIGEQRFDLEPDPEEMVDPDDIGDTIEPNPYWPLTAGHTQVIRTEEEVTVVTATEEVREIGGLPCRVVRDLVFEVGEDDEGDVEYEAIEVTQDWYAQHTNGDVIYCGENTYEVVDGLIDNTDGSFAHRTNRARAGVLVRRFPVVGEGDRQELATDEAEDYVVYVSLASSPGEAEGGDDGAFPCDGRCLQTFEVNPNNPGDAEYKYYLAGTGFVVATKLVDGEATGEREEVTCMGDSLEVLRDPMCGIEDVDALIDELCRWGGEEVCLES